MTTQNISIVDSHTGGEPTRIVVDAPFDLGRGSLQEKRQVFQRKFDHYRQAIVCEPRGSDVMVGALLTEPTNTNSVAGVIFFNNVGFLGMCGHGMMGVAVALAHLGRIEPGAHQVDTPVGTVKFLLHDQYRVALNNVPSYRFRAGVELQMGDGARIHGDIAWGGNWFFICHDHGQWLDAANVSQLGQFTAQVRELLDSQGIFGADGAIIDHIELIGPVSDASQVDAKNFVMCPGGAYDRSPCGTGTSAKLACLAADRLLAPQEIFRQQSIIGSVFEASYQTHADGYILPTITGEAYVIGEGRLILDDIDPFAMGIGPAALPSPGDILRTKQINSPHN